MRSTLNLASAGLLLLLAAISLAAAFRNIDADLSPDAEIVLTGAAILLAVFNLICACTEEKPYVRQPN